VADFEESRIGWRKSTASSSGACVEVAVTDRSVLIRDSANPGGPVLKVPTSAWPVFLASAGKKNFDFRRGLAPGTELTECQQDRASVSSASRAAARRTGYVILGFSDLWPFRDRLLASSFRGLSCKRPGRKPPGSGLWPGPRHQTTPGSPCSTPARWAHGSGGSWPTVSLPARIVGRQHSRSTSGPQSAGRPSGCKLLARPCSRLNNAAWCVCGCLP